jgi:uncharacterized C2H2 Zn-finger protein
LHGPNVNLDGKNVNLDGKNVNPNGKNVNPETINGKQIYKCNECYKTYLHKKSLMNHIPNCEKVFDMLECPKCNIVFACRQSLSKHKKVCKGHANDLIPIPNTSTEAVPSHVSNMNNTISGNHNTAIGTQNNTINIIAFPKGLDDDSFKFVKDHITPAVLGEIMKKKPEIAFANYFGALLEKEENRMIRKQNPNVNYCSIHEGDDTWNLVLDQDAIPTVAHHVTISSFEDILKNKKKLQELQIDLDKLRNYIDDINTANDENDNYYTSLQRIKLMLVNFTRKWGKKEEDL